MLLKEKELGIKELSRVERVERVERLERPQELTPCLACWPGKESRRGTTGMYFNAEEKLQEGVRIEKEWPGERKKIISGKLRAVRNQ